MEENKIKKMTEEEYCNGLKEKLKGQINEELEIASACFEKQVVSIGDGAHINIPKRFIGLTARIILKAEPSKEVITFEASKTRWGEKTN